jgi:hypothetical protein
MAISFPAGGCRLPSATINLALFDSLAFDLLHDVAPVSGLIDFPLVLVVNPSIRPNRLRNSLPMARAIRARSAWRRLAPAQRPSDRHPHRARAVPGRSAGAEIKVYRQVDK